MRKLDSRPMQWVLQGTGARDTLMVNGWFDFGWSLSMGVGCWCNHSQRSHRPLPQPPGMASGPPVVVCAACARLEAKTGLNCSPRHAPAPVPPPSLQAEAVRVLAELQGFSPFRDVPSGWGTACLTDVLSIVQEHLARYKRT